MDKLVLKWVLLLTKVLLMMVMEMCRSGADVVKAR